MDEAENQINDLEHKEAKNNQSEHREEKIIEKIRIVLGASGTLIIPTFTSWGCQKVKRKNKKLEIYWKKIMKENIPNLIKEIDLQVQEAQRVPNKMDTKRPTLRHIIIKKPKIKDKERILKAAREK